MLLCHYIKNYCSFYFVEKVSNPSFTWAWTKALASFGPELLLSLRLNKSCNLGFLANLAAIILLKISTKVHKDLWHLWFRGEIEIMKRTKAWEWNRALTSLPTTLLWHPYPPLSCDIPTHHSLVSSPSQIVHVSHKWLPRIPQLNVDIISYRAHILYC